MHAPGFNLQSRQVRAGLVLFAVVVYALLFVPLYRIFGISTNILIVVPVMAAAWFFGPAVGVAAGLLGLPLDTILLNFAGQIGWDAALQNGRVFNYAVLMLVGACIGWLCDASGKLRNEIGRREGAEQETAKLTRDLERLVSDRTTQLAATNQDLENRIVELNHVQKELQDSETRFRRLFETAQDGILLLDAGSGQITEVNPFLIEMLGYSRDEFLGKRLWEISPFRDVAASRIAFHELQRKEYIRYEDLPLETSDKRQINVEFVSNVYRVDSRKVIQCNVRDITQRRKAEEALREANTSLTEWVNELEQRQGDMTLLNEMADLLQTCGTVEEAHRVIAQFAPKLFPSEPGLLGVIDVSDHSVKSVVTWGDSFNEPNERSFSTDDCWALRRTRLHRVDDTQVGLLCKHLSQPLPPAYVCIPLLSHNETMGLLHLKSSNSARISEAKQQLALTVSRQIELALANLKLRQTLHTQSIRDPLTGLFNRRYMEESLEREVHRAEREQTPLGIIILDLDHFKEYNDALGHGAGDTLLRNLGEFLDKCVRGGDIACRYGGEEFILILPGASVEVSGQRAEQLRREYNQFYLEQRGKESKIPLTISLGVAVLPTHGSTAEVVLRAADVALYRAKAEGRDRVSVA